MNAVQRVAMLGVGYAVPDLIRGNDDPVFDWLRTHQAPDRDIFSGLSQRRVLARPQDVVELMANAARRALDDADQQPQDVDLLFGSASVSRWDAPNGLAAVHAALGLSSRCRVIALDAEYTSFHDGMKLAHDLVSVGTARCALVASGCNWTHHVDYHEAVALAASDGAGAAVVGRTSDPAKFRLLDWENETRTEWLGAFRMAPRPLYAAGDAMPRDTGLPDAGLYSVPLMKLDDVRGAEAVKQFGIPGAIAVVQRLLARHGLDAGDVALVPHQTSKFVQDAWAAGIQPGQYISTLAAFGDMVSASVPVNLAKCQPEITKNRLVLLGIGMEMRATALLYARGPA